LNQAVADGYLNPPKAASVPLKFMREGIKYKDLTPTEQKQYEEKFGDPTVTEVEDISSEALNRWLFNTDTVDKVLDHLMTNGIKVQGGDKIGKTIIFAKNHNHAVFIEERFNKNYPEYGGNLLRVIDNYEPKAQDLLDRFCNDIKEQDPQIAVSVDMMDTGVDAPRVVNLIFFKLVRSASKFWQMIGRGTRLCSDLYGPDQDKQDFQIFDFCYNFDFFRENPQGIEAGNTPSLGIRLFRARVDLLKQLQEVEEFDPEQAVIRHLTRDLHGEVSAMNTENFIVRMKQQVVERFQNADAWSELSDEDQMVLANDVAGLPSELDSDDIRSRMFDLTVLRMQTALLNSDSSTFENNRNKVIEITMKLEEKTGIPAVRSQLDFIQAVQSPEFWEGMDVPTLEDLRLRLRGLAPFLDKKERKIVYTDFQDEIIGVRDDPVVDIPKMTSVQFEKKVKDYLRSHLDNIVIQRLRKNRPLTEQDLEALEQMLIDLGEDDNKSLLSGLLERSGAPSLPYFVRSLVGMDEAAAKEAFGKFISDTSLTAPQIRFVETLIEQLASRGVIEPYALYEPPFSSIHAGGPEELFAGQDQVIEGIFDALDRTKPASRDAAAG
jgi:type I restriction enzyme R subunit